eukprot:1428740-Rhodomonas_salina.4
MQTAASISTETRRPAKACLRLYCKQQWYRCCRPSGGRSGLEAGERPQAERDASALLSQTAPEPSRLVLPEVSS